MRRRLRSLVYRTSTVLAIVASGVLGTALPAAASTPVYYTVHAGDYMAAWGDVYFSGTYNLSGTMSLFANSNTSGVYYQFCWRYYYPNNGWAGECGSKKYFTATPGTTQTFPISKSGGMAVGELTLTIYGNDLSGWQVASVTNRNADIYP